MLENAIAPLNVAELKVLSPLNDIIPVCK